MRRVRGGLAALGRGGLAGADGGAGGVDGEAPLGGAQPRLEVALEARQAAGARPVRGKSARSSTGTILGDPNTSAVAQITWRIAPSNFAMCATATRSAVSASPRPIASSTVRCSCTTSSRRGVSDGYRFIAM